MDAVARKKAIDDAAAAATEAAHAITVEVNSNETKRSGNKSRFLPCIIHLYLHTCCLI